ncbi:MAG: tripartite tricarboxylate transporter substrate binding protein [Ramlibacter sp.]|jgi:tripartite-type tricarboxylate transporter receptor subunit TctC|nr:tripartite tricarboxylate transporter substrate binding protein [Ramlibacter sp.]
MTDRLSRRAFASAAAVATFSLATKSAWADSYPSRTIKIILPYTAGGGSDPFARVTAQYLAKSLGVGVIVENRPGGNTVIGATAVAKAPPDGYTLLVTTDQTIEVNPLLYKRLPYDPLKDFIPLVKGAETAQAFLVSSSLPVNNLRDFVQLAKSKPGHLSYGTAGGNGSPSHLSMVKFMRETGTDMIHVAFKGTAPALTEVAAGRVSAAIVGMSGATPFLQAGSVKVLTIGSVKRVPSYPTVPTYSEALGIPYEPLVNWTGFLAPAGTPKPIVDKLIAEILKAMDSPEMTKQLAFAGWDKVNQTGDDFARAIVKGQAKWAAAAKDANLVPE